MTDTLKVGKHTTIMDEDEEQLRAMEAAFNERGLSAAIVKGPGIKGVSWEGHKDSLIVKVAFELTQDQIAEAVNQMTAHSNNGGDLECRITLTREQLKAIYDKTLRGYSETWPWLGEYFSEETVSDTIMIWDDPEHLYGFQAVEGFNSFPTYKGTEEDSTTDEAFDALDGELKRIETSLLNMIPMEEVKQATDAINCGLTDLFPSRSGPNQLFDEKTVRAALCNGSQERLLSYLEMLDAGAISIIHSSTQLEACAIKERIEHSEVLSDINEWFAPHSKFVITQFAAELKCYGSVDQIYQKYNDMNLAGLCDQDMFAWAYKVFVEEHVKIIDMVSNAYGFMFAVNVPMQSFDKDEWRARCKERAAAILNNT